MAVCFLQEVCKLPEVSLSSVQEGGTIGILCKSCDKTLHFYIDHTHLEVKLPEGNVRLPSTRYTVVDLYGQCRSIELRPLADLSEVPDAAAAADVSISLVKEDLTHVKRHKHRHRQQQISHNHQQHQENGHSEHPSSQQIPPDQIQSTSRVEEEERNGVARKPDSSGAVMSVPPVDRGHITMSSYQDCNYYQLCKAFLNHLMLPGMLSYLHMYIHVDHVTCHVMFHITIVWYVSYLRSHDMSCDFILLSSTVLSQLSTSLQTWSTASATATAAFGGNRM